jgi:hypothetical protein
MVNNFVASIVLALSRLIAIMTSAPLFILPAGAIGVVGGAIGQVYIKAQLSVTRERSNAEVCATLLGLVPLLTRVQAPVVAAINDVLSGLISIRAFDAQTMFIKMSEDRVDAFTRVNMIYYHLSRWMSVRIQVNCAGSHHFTVPNMYAAVDQRFLLRPRFLSGVWTWSQCSDRFDCWLCPIHGGFVYLVVSGSYLC